MRISDVRQPQIAMSQKCPVGGVLLVLLLASAGCGADADDTGLTRGEESPGEGSDASVSRAEDTAAPSVVGRDATTDEGEVARVMESVDGGDSEQTPRVDMAEPRDMDGMNVTDLDAGDVEATGPGGVEEPAVDSPEPDLDADSGVELEPDVGVNPAPGPRGTLNGPVLGWEMGAEPAWISMYEYVPEALAPNPPILVIPHFCSGNAVGAFRQAEDGGIVAAVDEHGFVILLPQTTRNCWDVATEPSLSNGAGGDTFPIVHQVQYALAAYNGNPDRVYLLGTSSGAMVTQAMLATYPDVFKAGVAFSGVPAGCWSVNNPDGQWSSPCAGGEVTHTGEEWGDMVRNMYPGYSGFRPRIQLWHGEADTIVSYSVHAEAIKQWTNVLGLDATPTSTTSETIDGGQYTREQWQDPCGMTLLDAWTQFSGPHGTDANMTAAYSIPFLALDVADAVDPQVEGCMSGAP